MPDDPSNRRLLDPLLLAIVDHAYLPPPDLASAIARIAMGGATWIQIRAKTLATGDLMRYVRPAGEAARVCGLPFIVNDRVDVAMATGADGVHVGADDLPVSVARELLGPGAIIGATVRDAIAARTAEREGASYLGVGPLFASSTKPELIPLPRDEIRRIREATDLPLVGIGGVVPERAMHAAALGIDGLAVVSYLWRGSDPATAARDLVHRFREGGESGAIKQIEWQRQGRGGRP